MFGTMVAIASPAISATLWNESEVKSGMARSNASGARHPAARQMDLAWYQSCFSLG